MGGHLGGEVAAEIAVTEITRRFQQEARNKLKKPFDFLVSAIQSAHRAIVSHAVEQNLLECPRTTVRRVHRAERLAPTGRTPATRASTCCARGEVIAHTQDHSRVQMMIDAGEITPEAAARHPERNKIFSCLGGVVPPADRDRAASSRSRPATRSCSPPTASGGRSPATCSAACCASRPWWSSCPGLLDGGAAPRARRIRQPLGGRDDVGEPGRRRVADTQQLDTSVHQLVQHHRSSSTSDEAGRRRDRRGHRARHRRDPERDPQGSPLDAHARSTARADDASPGALPPPLHAPRRRLGAGRDRATRRCCAPRASRRRCRRS